MAYLTPDKTYRLDNGLLIKEYLLTSHNPNRIALPAKRNAPLIGVTLHNTEWIDVNPATTPAEQYTRATVNGNMNDVRIHWYVDDKCAWRTLGDDYESWHAATGAGGQGNCNTISIECIMRNKSDAASRASMDNSAKLIAWIFGQYAWTLAKNLFTHNYWTNYKSTGKMSTDLDAQSLKVCSDPKANASGKYCPVYILPQWDSFKALTDGYMKAKSPAAPPATTMYRVRKAWEDSKSQIGAYSNLDGAKALADENKASGYKVFDDVGAVVYIPAVSGAGGDNGEYDRLLADHKTVLEELDRLRQEKAVWKLEEIELHARISELEDAAAAHGESLEKVKGDIAALAKKWPA
jgi:N-acetylmuramoyl-L-alanine amidase